MLKKALESGAQLGQESAHGPNPLIQASNILRLRSVTCRDLSSRSLAVNGPDELPVGSVGSVRSFDEPFGSPPINADVIKSSDDTVAARALSVARLESTAQAPCCNEDVFAFEEEIDKSSCIRGTCSSGGGRADIFPSQQPATCLVPTQSQDPMTTYLFKAANSAPDLISQALVNSLRISYPIPYHQNQSECNGLMFGSQVARPSLPLAINSNRHKQVDVSGGSPDNFLPPHELVAASFKGSPMSKHMNSLVGSALNHNSTAGSRHRSVADRIRHTVFEQQG